MNDNDKAEKQIFFIEKWASLFNTTKGDNNIITPRTKHGMMMVNYTIIYGCFGY